MKKLVSAMFMLMAGAVLAVTANSSVQLQRGKPDGYKTVAHAQWLGASGKLEEGRAFIAELRAQPLEGHTVEEIQAADMAEFAFLRSSIKSEKKRCIECLKSVYDTSCTSFWGWAAYTFLKDLGEEIAEPPKDPLRGLGELGDGVVNLEPKRLGNGERAGECRVPSVACPAKFALSDLKPGSPACSSEPGFCARTGEGNRQYNWCDRTLRNHLTGFRDFREFGRIDGKRNDRHDTQGIHRRRRGVCRCGDFGG